MNGITGIEFSPIRGFGVLKTVDVVGMAFLRRGTGVGWNVSGVEEKNTELGSEFRSLLFM